MVDSGHVITGHSDSTFKLWLLNPNVFKSSFMSDNPRKAPKKGGSSITRGFEGRSPKPFKLVYLKY